MIRPRVLAIFPAEGDLWRGAEARLRRELGEAVTVPHGGAGWPEVIGEADIFIGFALTEEMAAAAKRLRWVQTLGTGTDRARLPAGRDVILTSARGLHGPAMSEAAFAFMLAHARSLRRVWRRQEERCWEPYESALLSGARLGILGTGAIAAALARRAAAFEMDVTGFSRAPRALPGFARVLPRAALAGAVSAMDYLVLLAPLDDATRDIVDARVLAAMKPGALLVNLGRGGLVDEAALIAALRGGRISAALDALAREPLPVDSPLWMLPNVTISPHSGGRHARYADDVLDLFFANLALFEAGRVDEMRNRIA